MLHIDIVYRDFESTDVVEYHLNTKLAHLLTWRSREIDHVHVMLGDRNGPRGVVDKTCSLTILMASGRLLRIEHHSHNLYDAISRAVVRAERIVRDEISALRSRNRRRSLAMMWG